MQLSLSPAGADVVVRLAAGGQVIYRNKMRRQMTDQTRVGEKPNGVTAKRGGLVGHVRSRYAASNNVLEWDDNFRIPEDLGASIKRKPQLINHAFSHSNLPSIPSTPGRDGSIYSVVHPSSFPHTKEQAPRGWASVNPTRGNVVIR